MALVKFRRPFFAPDAVKYDKGVQEFPDEFIDQLPSTAQLVDKMEPVEIKPIDSRSDLHNADAERASSDALVAATAQANEAVDQLIAGSDIGAAIEERAVTLEKEGEETISDAPKASGRPKKKSS
jgi:hypothetical protein|tara:strand:- start:2978 stop:3352 length:375 start_codon:yes stop_codon:yes gene_type:complete